MSNPPRTRRDDDAVDTWYGTAVPDPYRWLEDPDGDETRAWVDAQNVHTEAFLDRIEARDRIAERLREAFDYERITPPSRHAGHLWYLCNQGLAQHGQLVRRQSHDAAPEVVLDPNTFSSDGTRALFGWAVSRDGRYLAYAVSDGGSDWVTWHVRDLVTGADLPDVLRHSKFSGATWLPDSSGFLYLRFPEPGEDTAPNKHQQIWLHRLHTPQEHDTLVHHDPDHPEHGFWPRISDDGSLLVVHVHVGTEERTRVWVKELRDGLLDAPFQRVLDAFDADYQVVGNRGRTVLVHTDNGAPRRRVIAIDLDHPERWREVVPEGPDTLVEVSLVGGRLFCTFLHHATSRVEVRDPDTGARLAEVPLPGPGSVHGFAGHEEDPDVYYLFSSYAHPTTAYRYEIETGAITPFFVPQVPVDLSGTTTEQIFVDSPDGTRVPAFVTWRGERPTDGSRPTLLYGYGGFNLPLLPWYDPAIAVWLELGGAWVVANLRGGGEYGREWHEAGTKLRKQNVFDDFVAVAEHLVATGFTRPERLAIHGRSNGGLLVGACLVQRPDLFGAAIPSVGVLDLLKYHLWTIGWAWASDYGTPDEGEEMFRALLASSPVHNAREGRYPATLVTTGDHDDRVVPAHSYKFAAALQAAQRGDAPVLVRVETRAGHGMGKPLSMAISERADMFAFLVCSLQMEEP